MKTKIVLATRTICDVCKLEAFEPIVCTGCEIDLCRACRIVQFRDPFCGEYSEGYPQFYCVPCFIKLTPFVAKAKDLLDSVYQLELDWRKACKPIDSETTNG